MKNIKKEKVPRELLQKITRISAHGLVLVVVTFLGLYLGMYIDKVTGLAPNFTFLFLIVGIVLGFKGFIQETITERKAKR
jgi:F0F1-type ATP synthase assembly protein I